MAQKYKIYVNNTPVYLLNAPGETEEIQDEKPVKTIQLAHPTDIIAHFRKIEESVEQSPTAFFCPHHAGLALIKELEYQYLLEQAGGGLVENERGEVLLIFRRGNWDFPKGKLDNGEDWAEAAKREVEEETGITVDEVGKLLAITHYTFQRKGSDTLKETRWFLMRASSSYPLQPQQDEDIDEVRWVKRDELRSYLSDSYPSLLDVVNSWLHAGG